MTATTALSPPGLCPSLLSPSYFLILSSLFHLTVPTSPTAQVYAPSSYFATEAIMEIKPSDGHSACKSSPQAGARGGVGEMLIPRFCSGPWDGLLVESPGWFPGHYTGEHDDIWALQLF